MGTRCGYMQLRELTQPSYIHRELSRLLINRSIPGPHVHLSEHVSGWWIMNTCIFFDLSSMILLISASNWTKGAWTWETVETKSMKCTINLPLWTLAYVQCIRCGVHRSRIAVHNYFLRVLQPSTLSTYYGFKSTNNIMQYCYSLTQHKLLTENAVVLQLKAITPQTDNRIISPRGFRWITRKLTKYSPTLNDFGKINKKLLSMRVLF